VNRTSFSPISFSWSFETRQHRDTFSMAVALITCRKHRSLREGVKTSDIRGRKTVMAEPHRNSLFTFLNLLLVISSDHTTSKDR
jgi:hypothetical protein